MPADLGCPGLGYGEGEDGVEIEAADVSPAMTSRTSLSSGPRRMWNSLPWSAWAFRSSMAAQIHMAGRICTRVSRQLVKRSFTPWKSMAKAPTSRASGASQRLRWLEPTRSARPSHRRRCESR